MFLTKRHIPRRTLLRGAGAAVALPFLESMLPAQTRLASSAANPVSRASFIYIPHGAIMSQWTPAQQGTRFDLPPILQSLEPFRDQLTVVSGLEAAMAGPATGESGGDHSRSAAVFLSGARPKHTAGSDVYLGTTVDQLVARKIGQDTPLPSLELGIEDVGYTGICGYGYSCSYLNTISWETPTKPLPMEINPQVVFERLFGDGATAEERIERKRQDRSILDSITHDVARLKKQIGSSDRTRLTDYLDDIREIERRLKLAENAGADSTQAETPIGIPQSFDEHVKLMYDLQVLAFKAEITRVSTFMYSRDNSNRTFPASGATVPFHGASHHSNRPEAIATYARINAYHISLLGHFLQRLRSTPDGDGTLLDHSLVVLGSTMSNGNEHDHAPLPMLVAGGVSGQLRGGRHLQFAARTPLSNLMLALLHKLGIERESIGDSTGALDI
jgi:hypothetical protein